MAIPLTTAPPLIVTPGGVSPSTAARAYQDVQDGGVGALDGNDFGSVLSRAVDGAISSSHVAESQSMQALSGNGNLTDVVQAVARAELTLQTTTAIRDRVVQAYQDIMRMTI